MDRDESLCEHCGRCCELKEKVGDNYKLTGEFCSHLIRLGNGKALCDIYKSRQGSRLDPNNVCVPSHIAVMFGDLPMDCPYAMRVPNYKTRVIDWMPKEN